MKIIGLLSAWASEDWIQYSIEQALGLVDELIISIGPYNEYFKMIGDKTFEKASKYFDNKKIKFVNTICLSNKKISHNRCATLNQMLQVSENVEIGNLIWLLDVDEFFTVEAINEIREFIINNEDFDDIHLCGRLFGINFNYYVETHLHRIFKIRSKNTYFRPTQSIEPKPEKTAVLLKNNPMFHYSLLTGEQQRGIYWLSEDRFKGMLWYMKIYKNYDPFNQNYWMEKNLKLTGNYGFWLFSWDIKNKIFLNKIKNSNESLIKYCGKHPELLENSSLRSISDFRVFMRKKPNYKNYIEAMKQLIDEKKKNSFRSYWNLKLSNLEKKFQNIPRLERLHNKLILMLIKYKNSILFNYF